MTTYEVIQHQEVGAGGAASITFSSIPQTYTDLQLVFSARSARTGVGTDDVVVQLNSTGANQSSRILWGTGSSAASLTDTQPLVGEYPTATNTANTFGSYQVYIPNYTSSVAKSFSADGVGENNATTSYQSIAAGLYNSTSAVTSILIKTGSGSNLAQYSSATLIGIKQAALPTPTDVYSDSLLEEIVLTSSAASVTFSNLNTYAALGYTNLQIRYASLVSTGGYSTIQFNADTNSANYAFHFLYGDGTSVGSEGAANLNRAWYFGNASYPNSGIIDLLDPFDSSKYSTLRTMISSSSHVGLSSSLWKNTAAVTEIKLNSPANFLTGSRFSLYGSK